MPQGSILGPLLFIIYINDLPTSQNTHTAIYTDGTAIYASSWSPNQTIYLQNHINTIIDYFKKWKLTVNPDETEAITFNDKRNYTSNHITIEGQNIPRTNTAKYLGVILDSKITWAPAIHKRTNFTHPTLIRLYPLISKNSKLKINIKINLYKTCVRPVITYEHQIWAAAAKNHINKVQKMQNKFLRIILNKPYDTPIKLLHQLANIPTIKNFIHNSTDAYHPNHENHPIRTIGDYQIDKIPLKIRTKLPMHATFNR